MERHYALPIALAAALHAGLLLGFRPTHPPAARTEESKRWVNIRDNLITDWADQHPDSPTDSSALPPMPPDQKRPSLPEPLPIDDPTRSAITLPTPTADGPIGQIKVDWTERTEGPGVIGGTRIGDVVSANLLDRAPRARFQAQPEYPFAAKHDGRNGEVVIEFTVDEEGRVLAPRVVRSTDREFEGPSLQAVSRWRFEPGRQNGQIVRFRMLVPMVFSLSDR